MKILFLYMFPLWGNGSASYLRELTAELIKRGHTVAILAPDKRKLPGVTHYIATPPQMGVFVGHPELPNAKYYADMSAREMADIYDSYLHNAIEAVDEFKPEIIHAMHTAFLAPIARTIKLIFGVPFITTTHGSDLLYLAQDRRLIGLNKDANRAVAAITANSNFTRKLYFDMFGKALARKTKVIPGGVSLDKFTREQKDIDYIDKEYGLTGKKVVLFTGRLTKAKGMWYLIKAAPKLHGTLVIVGDGPERPAMEEEIKNKKLKNVVMAGYHNPDEKRNLHAFYERADVYISPTVWEGFGLTLLEAMAAHTPVIASNKGGILSIIKDKVNGFLINPRNATQIAETINMLLDDDELRQKLAQEAYKTVIEKFTWGKIAAQFEDLYKQHASSTTEYMKLLKVENPKHRPIVSALRTFFGI